MSPFAPQPQFLFICICFPRAFSLFSPTATVSSFNRFLSRLLAVSGPTDAIIENLVETVSQKEKFILKLVNDFLTLKNSAIDATIRGNNSRANAHTMRVEISVQLQKQIIMQQDLCDFCKKAAFFEQICSEHGIQAAPPKLPTSGFILTEKGYTLIPRRTAT